jgi:hypothetical protein
MKSTILKIIGESGTKTSFAAKNAIIEFGITYANTLPFPGITPQAINSTIKEVLSRERLRRR